MSIKVCDNGHLYDDRHYSACPQCGSGSVSSDDNNANKSTSVKKIVISRRSVEDDGEKTVSYYSEYKGNNYITGWLVCSEGPEKGRDYRLYFGFNRLGSSAQSDVFISGDPGIAQRQHCSVVYDNKSNKFYIVPGKGTLTYLNKKLLKKACELDVNDSIVLSDTKLIFIPYCGGNIKWDQ